MPYTALLSYSVKDLNQDIIVHPLFWVWTWSFLLFIKFLHLSFQNSQWRSCALFTLPVTRVVLGCDLGMLNPSSTILCHRKAKQVWCALGRAPAEWLAEKRGVCVTQNPESARLWRTPSIGPVGGTAEHTHISVCMEPTGSLTRDSAPRNATHSFHRLLCLWLKPLFIFHAYGAESIPHPSLLQFYIVLWLGQQKLSKRSRISTQQLLEKNLHFAGIHSLQN